MSIEAVPNDLPRSLPPRAPRGPDSDSDQATLLGLYHGYDQARIALARLVSRFGAEAQPDEETARRIWARTERAGLGREIFDPPTRLPASCDGLNRGAHAAVLTAFATVSEKAEELLRTLRARWPELCEDVGGPLPVPRPAWELE